MDKDILPTLHIYGQESRNSPAFIVGNRDGLQVLGQAIDEALTSHAGDAATPTVWPSDGEGYGVVVVRLGDAKGLSLMKRQYTLDPAPAKDVGANSRDDARDDNGLKRLQLYAQESWHMDAFILGNRSGLEALSQAVDEAMATAEGIAATPTLLPVDDEDYQVLVVRLDDVKRFGLLIGQYTAEFARSQDATGLRPLDLSDRTLGILSRAANPRATRT